MHLCLHPHCRMALMSESNKMILTKDSGGGPACFVVNSAAFRTAPKIAATAEHVKTHAFVVAQKFASTKKTKMMELKPIIAMAATKNACAFSRIQIRP